jgi:hypothetical protein
MAHEGSEILNTKSGPEEGKNVNPQKIFFFFARNLVSFASRSKSSKTARRVEKCIESQAARVRTRFFGSFYVFVLLLFTY